MSLEKSAVVTGASTGIGRAICDALLGAGWRVFGSVRKSADAARLKAELGEHFTPLLFDVTDDAAVRQGALQVETALAGRTLGALVNNAGIAVGGPLRYIPIEEIERQFDVNVLGAVRATQAFLPSLGADRRFAGHPGRIVNMSSVAGKIASPFLAPYAMSKHALEAFSDSLRRELLPHGIDVVVVGPGSVATPIWAKADEINVEQYRQTEYFDMMTRMRDGMQAFGAQGLPPEAIGRLVRDAVEASKPRTRYAALKNKFMLWTLPNLLPKRMVDAALAKRFGIPQRTE
ncbi:MAG: SDR family oxidoreductase [Parvularculaceae bacterium]|nr:SDR family oxidoreductase [Parvularculaceae bacterium]